MRYTLSVTGKMAKKLGSNNGSFTFVWNNFLDSIIRHAEAVDVPEDCLLIGDRETGKVMTINEARTIVMGEEETDKEPFERDPRADMWLGE